MENPATLWRTETLIDRATLTQPYHATYTVRDLHEQFGGWSKKLHMGNASETHTIIAPFPSSSPQQYPMIVAQFFEVLVAQMRSRSSESPLIRKLSTVCVQPWIETAGGGSCDAMMRAGWNAKWRGRCETVAGRRRRTQTLPKPICPARVGPPARAGPARAGRGGARSVWPVPQPDPPRGT